MKVDVAGLQIDAITKQDLLKQVTERIKQHQKTFVVTPYSEFLYASLRNPDNRKLLNSADFSIADGVGIFWADLFLSQPFTRKSFYGKLLQAWWQMVWTGASILLDPKKLYQRIPEKIVGANLIWDLAQMAVDNNFRVYLLGSKGGIAERAAKKLQSKFPNLQIVGTSNKNPDDLSSIDDINTVNPDMLFVTYNGFVQEKWLADNLQKTTASFGIALGGTFDYLAGAKKQPPQFVRSVGLEWLYRLITQPSRLFRIYRGVWGLIISLVRVKVFGSMPLRVTTTAVVVNEQGKIFVCKQSERVTKKFNPHMTGIELWQFPQGGLEEGESIEAGARRELQEEAGVKTVELIKVAEYKNQYIWPNALRPFLRSHYKKSGGDMRTVFFRFTGDDSEIKLDYDEVDGYAWVDKSEIEHLFPEFRHQHAKAVLAELAKLTV